MQARVEDDPRHQEPGKRCHEALLHQLPNPAVGVLIHILEVDGVQIDDPAADAGKAVRQSKWTIEWRWLFIGYR